MEGLSFGFRQSVTESYDDTRSRYVPSSVYSGPGPDFEAPLRPVQLPVYPTNESYNDRQHEYRRTSKVQSSFVPRPRHSVALNVSDPVAMHLLTETALSDSKNYNVLSFEELEQLKKKKAVLRGRVEATRRKLALEHKLRDAAQSLGRLYTQGRSEVPGMRGHGSKESSSSADMSSRVEDEYTSSSRKVEQYTQDLKNMELQLEDAYKRILEHTAGILQLTHRGLKKNLRKHELPRSPESMASLGHRSISGGPLLDEFDERSLYPVPDYVNDFTAATPITPIQPTLPRTSRNSQALDGLAARLRELSSRMHSMALQSSPAELLVELPDDTHPSAIEETGSQIQAHLNYLSQSMDALMTAQQRAVQESENVNARIHDMLESTDSVSRSPMLMQDEPRGEDVASQLAFSTRVLEQLRSRIETLVEQKDILTRQIQQQRDLNSKSDAQRDAQIRDLTDELTETKRLHLMIEEEAQQSQSQISQLIDQLDRARSDTDLLEQQRGMNDSNALQAERAARKEAEQQLLKDLDSEHHINAGLQADISKLQNDFEVQSQQRTQQINELSKAREDAEIIAERHRSESEKLLEQIASIQTELTMAKAELDGAYGSRAQRAADVSSNPAVQRQIDGLQNQNSQLQKELKETIDDYEQMTKASIEFEKERDNLEMSIDSLRDKCEALESQLNEERLKSLGTKSPASTDTTSTMVLKNEFKKMMRDTRAESIKAIRAEQEERRRLESIIRQMKKDMGLGTPAKPSADVSIPPSSVGTAT